MSTNYKERNNAFMGKILKVTVDVKPIGAAVKAEADRGQTNCVSPFGVGNPYSRGLRIGQRAVGSPPTRPTKSINDFRVLHLKVN